MEDLSTNATHSLRVNLKRNFGLNSIKRDNVTFVDDETVAFFVGNLVQFLNQYLKALLLNGQLDTFLFWKKIYHTTLLFLIQSSQAMPKQ